jgi:hypothetical protein
MQQGKARQGNQDSDYDDHDLVMCQVKETPRMRRSRIRG